ncbi:MAG: HAMP domain-containing protein [Burkholderiales bacterium]|nr:HAMP domain-containing protein [Burkholderiales bacterium]
MSAPAAAPGGASTTGPLAFLRRFDTLALRLFVLMWVTLVLSHAVALLAVHGVQAPPSPPGEGIGVLPQRWPDDRRPGSPEDRRPGMPDDGAPGLPDARPPGMPDDRRPTLPGDWRLGPPPGAGGPPLPTLGSLPPTPGLHSDAGARGAPQPLPARALALDYGVRLIVIALAAWWGARWLARPVAYLVTAAESLGAGLAHGQAPAALDEEDGTREVRAAASVFNRMAAQIRQLFESRGLMMASISHDLRTPLTRMRMRLETTDVPATLRERCIADLGEMNTLIDAVLDIFRAATGPARDGQRVDIAALLQALVDDHAEQGHPVRAAIPSAPLVLRSDALALRRIVDNLVVNALRYAGSAEVSLAQVREGVRITVDDRGPGIAPERLADVLQPFVRLESSRNRATGGAGLGLAIAHELTQGLGGTLSLNNRVGGGLSAQVLLPGARAAA